MSGTGEQHCTWQQSSHQVLADSQKERDSQLFARQENKNKVVVVVGGGQRLDRETIERGGNISQTFVCHSTSQEEGEEPLGLTDMSLKWRHWKSIYSYTSGEYAACVYYDSCCGPGGDIKECVKHHKMTCKKLPYLFEGNYTDEASNAGDIGVVEAQ